MTPRRSSHDPGMPTIPGNPKMRTVRFHPPPDVELPQAGAPPLIDPNAPDDKQLQEIWTARVRVFDLSKEDQLRAYEAMWQKVCDGRAHHSDERIEWDSANGRFLVYARWSDVTIRAPSI